MKENNGNFRDTPVHPRSLKYRIEKRVQRENLKAVHYWGFLPRAISACSTDARA
jgi:hypothetical protein